MNNSVFILQEIVRKDIENVKMCRFIAGNKGYYNVFSFYWLLIIKTQSFTNDAGLPRNIFRSLKVKHMHEVLEDHFIYYLTPTKLKREYCVLRKSVFI